jgi:hypothetical protein
MGFLGFVVAAWLCSDLGDMAAAVVRLPPISHAGSARLLNSAREPVMNDAIGNTVASNSTR